MQHSYNRWYSWRFFSSDPYSIVSNFFLSKKAFFAIAILHLTSFSQYSSSEMTDPRYLKRFTYSIMIMFPPTFIPHSNSYKTPLSTSADHTRFWKTFTNSDEGRWRPMKADCSLYKFMISFRSLPSTPISFKYQSLTDSVEENVGVLITARAIPGRCTVDVGAGVPWWIVCQTLLYIVGANPLSIESRTVYTIDCRHTFFAYSKYKWRIINCRS